MCYMSVTDVEHARKVRTTTAIRFPEELHDRLRVVSEAFGLPINFIVVKAMEEFLDRMIDPSEFRLTKNA